MLKTALVDNDFAHICSTLYSLAQRHIPANAVGDVNELAHVAKLLKESGISPQIAPKISAHVDDYSSSVVKQSAEYRLIRARFAAALGTIADMGSKKIKKNKSEFHAGINEGLRRAAKIAIMFLEDLDAGIYTSHTYCENDDPEKITEPKPRSSFVR
jgi:hypothetical protein